MKLAIYIIIFLLFSQILLTNSRSYPLYKQCDPKWKSITMGSSTSTICQKGCLISSVAMALNSIGKNYTPQTLNTWLTANKGYVDGNTFVWGSINTLGVTYQGKFDRSKIKAELDKNSIVICKLNTQ